MGLDLKEGASVESLPLGDLAYAVLEQHGAAAEAAVATILERVRAALPPDLVTDVMSSTYGGREAAREPLQPGNWVTLGEVAAAAAITFVEVNVATGATRERCAWSRSRGGGARFLPTQVLQASCAQLIDRMEVNRRVRDSDPDA